MSVEIEATALRWADIELRNRLYAGSRIGRAVWMFVKWVQPTLRDADKKPPLEHSVATREALAVLERARLEAIVQLTGTATRGYELHADVPAAELPVALLKAAAARWMRFAEQADSTLLQADGRWVRGCEPAERARLVTAFELSLLLHLAERLGVCAPYRGIAELRERLEALAEPLASTVASLPPMPLTKDFACATFPLWDTLDLRWRDSHSTRTMRVRTAAGALELTLDGVLR